MPKAFFNFSESSVSIGTSTTSAGTCSSLMIVSSFCSFTANYLKEIWTSSRVAKLPITIGVSLYVTKGSRNSKIDHK